MPRKTQSYIPALNRHWLTPFYDPVMHYLMREDFFRPRLVTLADPQPGERILDLGCGTGTLTEMLQIYQADAKVVGIDVDPDIIKIAQRKMQRDRITQVEGTRGYIFDLPYADGVFNMVVSSLVVHHLKTPDKIRTFREVARVLIPGGRFCIADFGPPHDGWMRLVTRWMIIIEKVDQNFKGAIPGWLSEAGFERIEESEHLRTFFGPLSFYRAYSKRKN